MEIKVEKLKLCHLVTVRCKSLDRQPARQLEGILLGLIQEGSKNLVVNLAAVTFISSAGLKALLSALITVRKAIPPGNIVVSEILPKTKASFETIGYDRQFTFYGSDAKAVGSF